TKSKDKDAFTLMLKEVKGNPAPKVTLGTVKMPATPHENLVQYDSTDWDFMCMRADACGRAVIVEQGEISIDLPRLVSPGTQINYQSDNIISLQIAADAEDMVAGYEVKTKDFHNAPTKIIKTALRSSQFSPKHFNGSKASKAVGGGQLTEFVSTPIPSQELAGYATGKMLRGNISATRGHIRLMERADLVVGKTAWLKGFKAIKSGKAFISGVKHQFDGMGWTVDVELGMSGRTYAEERQWTPSQSQDMLPPVPGLQYAEVKEIKKDPTNKLRVLVTLPSDLKKPNQLWAELATPYAGKDHGIWFHPEVGDLVILGFINNDPRFPVILGGVMRKTADNPTKWVKTNDLKGILLQKGLGMVLDEKKEQIILKTDVPATQEQSVILDKKKGSVTLSHKKGGKESTILLDASGVQITTKGDLKINAKAITLKGTGAVTIQGTSIDLKN
ncbi:MAG: phage baseplate assembly protein V, partial [Bacteroidota bacterium]